MEKNFKIWLFTTAALGCFQAESSAMDEADLESISTHVIRGNQDVSQWCKECVTNKITEGSIITAADFRKEFRSFREKLLTKEENFNNFLENIFHDYLKNFHEASTYIQNISTEPEEDYNESAFTLQGSIIGTSDLIRMKNNKSQNFFELNIKSQHSLLIDQDLEAPGVNVTWFAPHWFVLETKGISLKGSEGADHDSESARHATHGMGENGEDGLPGLPGKRGGHFFGKGTAFHNLDFLTIDVSGGKGGKGQNGGNGGNGAPAKIRGNKEDVETRKEDTLKLSERILFDDNVHLRNLNSVFTFGNTKFKEVYASGEMGQQGGDAGRGGKGGYPGENGFAYIQNSLTGNDQTTYSLLETPLVGDNGKPGIPGLVGDYLIYSRTYINERLTGGVAAEEITGELLMGGAIGGAGVGIGGTMGGVGGAGLLAAGGTAATIAAGPVIAGVAVGVGVAAVTVGLVKGLGSLISAAAYSKWEGPLEELNQITTPWPGKIPSDLNEGIVEQNDYL